MSEPLTDFQAAYNAGMEASAPALPPSNPSCIPYVMAPNGFVVPLEHLLPSPVRKRCLVVFDDLASFCGYLGAYHYDHSAVFVTTSPTGLQAEAIIDFHSPHEDPDWCEDRATYSPRFSPEWMRWNHGSSKRFSQVEFADMLETNLIDVETPTGADLLEVCSNLVATKSVTFKSSVRLDNGTSQFTFDEEGKSEHKKGNMLLPNAFTLGIRVFEDDEAGKRIPCLLRHKIDGDGVLTFTYIIQQPERIIEKAVKDKVDAMRKGIPETVLIARGRYVRQ